MTRNRFRQPEDYQPAPIDREEKILDLYRDKRKEDLYEAEEDERRVEDDRYE